ILDLGLPGMDGHSVLRRMRDRDDRTPVLVLTARDSLSERVNMLNDSADDFLPKPFRIEELEARLLALIRRSRGREHPRFTCGCLSEEPSSHCVMIAEEQMCLVRRKHAVLRILIQRSGEPLNKQ